MPTQHYAAEADVAVIGAGPCGLFQVFELGLQGLDSLVLDAQPRTGGQCRQLYPNKPIFDIPGIPRINGACLIDRLQEQIAPFKPQLLLNREVAAINRLADNQGFALVTEPGDAYRARFIVLATGAGAMTPVSLRVAGIEQFSGKSLFYHVEDPERHKNCRIAVLGGGDAALDWALALAPLAAELTLVHRSSRLRAAPDSVARYNRLCDQGAARMLQGQVTGYVEDDRGELGALKIQGADGVIRRLDIDHVLVFFGMAPDIRALRAWGVDMERFQVRVRTDTFETSAKDIYAIGDCNHYPGKRKLILSGFHEAALAAFAISQRVREACGDERDVPLEYTTTSPTLRKRLGVENA
jgi:thioredoxin reductase (NADPH)